MSIDLDALFKLRKPCADCPFRKVGAIDLRPGRIESIVAGIVGDDMAPFLCHKTLKSTRAYCTGAMVYLEKVRMPNVAMRLGKALGMYDPAIVAGSFDDVIEPLGD